jgi:hypothetical protein
MQRALSTKSCHEQCRERYKDARKLLIKQEHNEYNFQFSPDIGYERGLKIMRGDSAAIFVKLLSRLWH